MGFRTERTTFFCPEHGKALRGQHLRISIWGKSSKLHVGHTPYSWLPPLAQCQKDTSTQKARRKANQKWVNLNFLQQASLPLYTHVTCSINLSISTKETWKLHSGGVFTYFLQQLSRNKGLHEPNGISKITNGRSTGPS